MSNFTTQQEKQKGVKEKEKLGRETLASSFMTWLKLLSPHWLWAV